MLFNQLFVSGPSPVLIGFVTVFEELFHRITVPTGMGGATTVPACPSSRLLSLAAIGLALYLSIHSLLTSIEP